MRILVLFTDAANLVGNPQNDADLFINQTNQICRNSEITQHDLNFELVGVENLPGVIESPQDIEFDLEHQLRLNQNAIDLRELYEADLVILLTDGNYFNNSVFGTSFLAEWGNDEFGFAIVEIDAAGERFTFAHEVAHLFGCKHNDDDRGAPDFEFDARGRVFYTNHGWWIFESQRRRHTVVTVGLGHDNTRIMNFSNPDVIFIQDGATGVTDFNDNADQLITMGCDVANYRFTQEPMSVNISGPSTMTEGYNHTWCANVNECNNVTSYTWAWSENGFTYYNFGNSRCVNRTSFRTNADRIFLRVITRCADGQTAIGNHTVIYSSDIFRIASTESEPEILLAVTKKLSINVYPNPSTDVAHIKVTAEENEEIEISIIDLMGKNQKTIFKSQLHKGTHYFNESITFLNPNLYSIVVKSKKYVDSKRLLIQK